VDSLEKVNALICDLGMMADARDVATREPLALADVQRLARSHLVTAGALYEELAQVAGILRQLADDGVENSRDPRTLQARHALRILYRLPTNG